MEQGCCFYYFLKLFFGGGEETISLWQFNNLFSDLQLIVPDVKHIPQWWCDILRSTTCTYNKYIYIFMLSCWARAGSHHNQVLSLLVVYIYTMKYESFSLIVVPTNTHTPQTCVCIHTQSALKTATTKMIEFEVSYLHKDVTVWLHKKKVNKTCLLELSIYCCSFVIKILNNSFSCFWQTKDNKDDKLTVVPTTVSGHRCTFCWGALQHYTLEKGWEVLPKTRLDRSSSLHQLM